MAVNDVDRAAYPMVILRHADDCSAKWNHDCNERHPQQAVAHIQHQCICGFQAEVAK